MARFVKRSKWRKDFRKRRFSNGCSLCLRSHRPWRIARRGDLSMFQRRSQISFSSLGLLMSGLFLSSCGYTLNHRLKEVFREDRSLFVPVFDNLTDETGVELVFTNALLREIKSRGQPKVAG